MPDTGIIWDPMPLQEGSSSSGTGSHELASVPSSWNLGAFFSFWGGFGVEGLDSGPSLEVLRVSQFDLRSLLRVAVASPLPS